MTLALYGKSRRRQGGLILAGFVALMLAIIAGVATYSSAFAHHLEGSSKNGTCDDPSWNVTVTTGQWSGYREAVLTITDDRTDLGGMRFTPYISDENGVILQANGTGLVHTSGNVKQYNGTWGDSENPEDDINSSTTQIEKNDGGDSGDTNNWDSDYQPGVVIRWDNELMLIVDVITDAENGGSDGYVGTEGVLIVERGFGDSNAASHNNDSGDDIRRWIRGSLEGSPNTISWDLDFDPADCLKVGVEKVVSDNLPPQGPGDEFFFNVLFQLTGSGVATGPHIITDTIPDEFEIISAVGNNGSITCDVNGQVVTCSLPQGTGGNTYSARIDVKVVDDPETCGVVTNTAILSGPMADPQDSTDTADVSVECLQVVDPGISKEKVDGGLTATEVFWNIFINNTASEVDQTVEIHDSNVAWNSNDGADKGTCADTDFSDGKIVCTVKAGQTFRVQVKKDRPVAQCIEQTINNTASLYLVRPDLDPKFIASDGGDSSTEYTIPGDPTKCDKPGITKTHSGPTSTTNPNDLSWTVEVKNPASGTGTAQTVWIKDSNVVVVSGPSFTGTADCDENTNPGFQTQLNDSDGVQCSMPNNSTITFVVKPAGTIARTCEDQKFNNTASIYVGSTTNTPIDAIGPELTLQGDPSLCKRTLEICKVFQGNSDGMVRNATFNFNVMVGGVQVYNGLPGGGLAVSEPDPDNGTDGEKVCKTVEVDANKTLQVVEWTPSFSIDTPKHSIDGGAMQTNGTTATFGNDANNHSVTFFNKEKTRNVQVCKVVISNGDSLTRDAFDWGFDVRKAGGSPVQQGSNTVAEPAGEAGTEAGAVCKTVKVSANIDLEVVEWTSRPGSPAWNDETGYPEYSINNGSPVSNNTTSVIAKGTSAVKVVFFNREDELDKEIIIEKRFIGLPDGYVPSPQTDYPTITLSDPDYPNVTFANNCSWVLNNQLDHVYAVCTVPFDWDGTIDETPPPGWVEVSCEPEVDQNPTFSQALVIERPDEVFCNAPFGTVIVNKLNSSTAGPNFEAVISGLPAESVLGAALDGSPTIAQGSPSNQTNVPLGNTPFSVSEVNAGTVETCGSGATTYFTIIQAPADTVLDTPGEIQTWTIVNQPCGVLGQGGIVLQKFRDNNGDGIANGADALQSWTFRITGPNGYDETFIVTAAEMPFLVGGLAPGDYTVSENTEAGWVTVGLTVDNGALVPAATQTTIAVDGAENVLRGVEFYNQPRVNIVATKTIFNNANPAGANGGAGWTFTLNGCGIGPDQKTTDATGTVTWTNLPPAVGCSYTITETQKAGWVADQISRNASPDEPGETVTVGFINRQIEGCTNINDCDNLVETPTPTNTPVTPTNTPDTDETPTTEPTATNTPDEDIAGEKTPGPGDQATPIAPDTGAGFTGTTSAGMNVLLIIAGLIAISGGLSFIALGRRKS